MRGGSPGRAPAAPVPIGRGVSAAGSVAGSCTLQVSFVCVDQDEYLATAKELGFLCGVPSYSLCLGACKSDHVHVFHLKLRLACLVNRKKV